MTTPVRTRFAPSPTGDLHIGNARAALFGWLFAKAQGGQFILRIEDTDKERSTQAATQTILDAMAWMGMDYDEGPFLQSERLPRYQEIIDQLLEEGKAYRCNCSHDRLDKLRTEQREKGEKPRYDGHCRDLNLAEGPGQVARFKTPASGSVTFHDLVRGEITVSNSELDDLVIARSSGMPTYNLSVVVDDWDMQISHVIRGDDHINNTPRQINLLQAIGAPIPTYAHVPMVLGADGKRLSKRHGANGVLEYRDMGILPDALLNYLARLGWSHGDQELFSVDELKKLFNLESVSRSPAVFDPEKLLWVNQQHLQEAAPEKIADQLSAFLEQNETTVAAHPSLEAVIAVLAPRSKTLIELAKQIHYFYHAPTQYAEKADKKQLTSDTLPMLNHLLSALSSLKDWSEESISIVIQEAITRLDTKMGKIAQPLRTAVTGDTVSPSIDITLQLIGQKPCCARISTAIKHIQAKM